MNSNSTLPAEEWEAFRTTAQDPPMLSFISQTGPKIQDPKVKRLVRQNARNHVSREKGKMVDSKPLQFRLLVPESFSFAPSYQSGGALEATDTLNEMLELNESNQTEIQTSALVPKLPVAFVSESQQEDQSRSASGKQTNETHVGSRNVELSTKQQMFRTKKPKVKTGCLTCKARHLKCDESKPNCLRCLRSIGTCTGYNGPPKATSSRSGPRSIIPRPSNLVKQPCVAIPFSDEKESYFFNVFLSETAADLSGVFKSSFWDNILIQESTHQTFVRYAIISIAALNASTKSTHLAQLATGSTKDVWQAEATRQQKYALEQYGKSINGMRTITTDCDTYFRKVVISTLLIFVFETIQVKPDSAFWHALVGGRMLCHWVTEQWGSKNSYRRGIASPASSIIEDEIVLMFCRFETQILTFVDTREPEAHVLGKRDGMTALEEMPLVFPDLSEATKYWELVLRRSCHFIMYGAVQTKSKNLQKDFPTTFGGKSIELNAENSIYGSPYTVPDAFVEEQSEQILEIVRWSSSFNKLLAKEKSTSADLREVTNIALVRMTSLGTKIAVTGTTFTNETSYDIFLPDFSEIVSLARQIEDNLLTISNNKPSFHFHTSVVPPLFIVLLRCRDPAIRREAIDILRMQQSDGHWDRFMIASIGKWIMDIEEEGWDGTGTIPEESRVQLSRIMMAIEEQSVMVQCVRRGAPETGGECQALEPSLTWLETVISGW